MRGWGSGHAKIAIIAALGVGVVFGPGCAGAPAPARGGQPAPAIARAPLRPSEREAIVGDRIERIALALGGPSRGAQAAKVHIIIFSNLSFEPCRRVEVDLERIAQAYPNDVRLWVRHYPAFTNSEGRRIVEAEAIANTTGRFWEAHDWLLRNAAGAERPNLDELPAALGIDPIRFRSALDQGMGRTPVDADVAVGRRLGVPMPSVLFVNGRPVFSLPFEQLRALVDDELARADSLLARGVPPAALYAAFTATANPSLATVPKKEHAAPPSAEIFAVETGDAPVRGATHPKVTIVEFGDFACPYSARASLTLAELVTRYRDDVAVVYRHLPLAIHPEARGAAVAAEAAAKQGRFWEMHDKLFAHYDKLNPGSLESYAQELGLDVAAFRHAVASADGKLRVERDTNLAARFGVRGTPHFFVNGRAFRGSQPIEAWTQLIDEELAKADTRLKAGTPRAALYSASVAGGLPGREPPLPPKATPLPEDLLQGQIVITKTPLLEHYPSKEAFLEAMRGSRLEAIPRTKEPDSPWGTWKINYVAFFKEPPQAREITQKVYVLRGAKKRSLVAEEHLPVEVDEGRIFGAQLVLREPFFAASKRYEMTFEHAGKVIASTKFRLAEGLAEE